MSRDSILAFMPLAAEIIIESIVVASVEAISVPRRFLQIMGIYTEEVCEGVFQNGIKVPL
jgi:hypothetical protein